MHVHISWAVALITLLTYICTVGVLNLYVKAHPGSTFANAWVSIASPV